MAHNLTLWDVAGIREPHPGAGPGGELAGEHLVVKLYPTRSAELSPKKLCGAASLWAYHLQGEA